MRILVTGAAGSIGRVVTLGLGDRGHDVVGLDLVPEPDGFTGPRHTADCSDARAVQAVFADERLDAVVHLAGHPGEADLPTSLTSHVITTAALLDACVAHRVSRFVYASSNHAVGRTPRASTAEGVISDDALPRPDTFYGVGKVAAEALMRLYADRHSIDAIACRIGSFLDEPGTTRALSTWLSHEDCVRMVEAALTASSPGFAVLYGISNNTPAWWDLEPGRRLGYDPVDDAEAYADHVAVRDVDDAEAAHVGGPFAGEEFYRPALGNQGLTSSALEGGH
ncbi:NAD-dependent epimerase/dehydratase family protein [Nocardioides sp. B-3]|uniref:NAD-dependent epimerase/dehydratase family protein n=1 Tax=Nocardioides sp. B-3 TaxID=2895565 RepID=UPI002152B431|nr:NAD(P)-dependent oxidoreductase [Nocardioides sp. B-3]UUZ58039.1 NAD(P)-dependent oxidoreductase [Nocardioides sp. B-3]